MCKHTEDDLYDVIHNTLTNFADCDTKTLAEVVYRRVLAHITDRANYKEEVAKATYKEEDK